MLPNTHSTQDSHTSEHDPAPNVNTVKPYATSPSTGGVPLSAAMANRTTLRACTTHCAPDGLLSVLATSGLEPNVAVRTLGPRDFEELATFPRLP